MRSVHARSLSVAAAAAVEAAAAAAVAQYSHLWATRCIWSLDSSLRSCKLGTVAAVLVASLGMRQKSTTNAMKTTSSQFDCVLEQLQSIETIGLTMSCSIGKHLDRSGCRATRIFPPTCMAHGRSSSRQTPVPGFGQKPSNHHSMFQHHQRSFGSGPHKNRPKSLLQWRQPAGGPKAFAFESLGTRQACWHWSRTRTTHCKSVRPQRWVFARHRRATPPQTMASSGMGTRIQQRYIATLDPYWLPGKLALCHRSPR
eukprot:SAG31_NODE_1796_length_7245_cov_57.374195_1_plen_256_part_00